VRRGEVFGFLGPNGSGKSTTVSMIVGLIAPTSGSVNAFGLELKDHYWEIMRRVGATIETPAFYPYLSGWDNLELFATAIGGIPSIKIKEVLERVNLLDRAKDKYKTYSLGMKQRLAIAYSLLRDRSSSFWTNQPMDWTPPVTRKCGIDPQSGQRKPHHHPLQPFAS